MSQARALHKPTKAEREKREAHSDKARTERQNFKLGKSLPSFKTQAGRSI